MPAFMRAFILSFFTFEVSIDLYQILNAKKAANLMVYSLFIYTFKTVYKKLYIFLPISVLVMPSTDQYQSATCVATLPPLTYLPRRLQGVLQLTLGYLILRGASRLDAFSVYPFPAWLLCHALGRTTDTPAASPSRSSRTKDSSSQISYAHAGQGPNCLTTF